MTDTNFLADRTGKMAHMTTTQSANLAQISGVKQLLLTHLPQAVTPETLLAQAKTVITTIPVTIAEQGLTIKID